MYISTLSSNMGRLGTLVGLFNSIFEILYFWHPNFNYLWSLFVVKRSHDPINIRKSTPLVLYHVYTNFIYPSEEIGHVSRLVVRVQANWGMFGEAAGWMASTGGRVNNFDQRYLALEFISKNQEPKYFIILVTNYSSFLN